MTETRRWIRICRADAVPPDGGATAAVDGRQIAVFHSRRLGRWFACENRCPHWREDVLARGILGDADGQPKVACPLHKRSFSLETGACLSGDAGALAVYPVKLENGAVYVALEVEAEAAMVPVGASGSRVDSATAVVLDRGRGTRSRARP